MITGRHYFYLCFRDENKLHESENKNQYMKINFFGSQGKSLWGANLFAKAALQAKICIECTNLFANEFAPT